MSVIALPSSDTTTSQRTRRGPYIPSKKRLTANRLNAQKSTGPRTPEGKSKVRSNALQHGLSVLQPNCQPHASNPEVDPDYCMFLEELRSDLKPVTVLQHHLFPLLADLLWRLRRIPHATQLLLSDPNTPACEQLARSFLSENPNNPFLLLNRYERALNNSLLRLLKQFHTITKESTKNPRSQYAPDEPPCPPERAWPSPTTKQTHSPSPSSSVSSVPSVAHPSSLTTKQTHSGLPPRYLDPENLPFLTPDEVSIAIAAKQLPKNFTPPPIPPYWLEDDDEPVTKQTHSTPPPQSRILPRMPTSNPFASTAPMLCPSILSADFAKLSNECQEVLAAGSDFLHLDVMDGHFVPNISFGPPIIKSLRPTTPVFFDAHLMIAEPLRYAPAFAAAGCNALTFHVEVTPDPAHVAREIRKLNLHPGITLNPATPLESILPALDHIDHVLVMSVVPGFSGQKFMPQVLPKCEQIKKRLLPHQRLQIDGGINPTTIVSAMNAGVDWFVVASAIFDQPSRPNAISTLRQLLQPT